MSKCPFTVNAILDKKFKQIFHNDVRKIWQYRVKWLGQADSLVMAPIAPMKASEFEARKDSPDEVESKNDYDCNDFMYRFDSGLYATPRLTYSTVTTIMYY